jgi:hypothetical protein
MMNFRATRAIARLTLKRRMSEMNDALKSRMGPDALWRCGALLAF